MSEVEVSETIMEAREELMVSVNGEGNPRLRLAYFLKPCVEQHALEFNIPAPPKLPMPNSLALEKLLNAVKFKSLLIGCKWKNWVHQLLPRHKATWIKSGILDAIMASTYNRTCPDNIRRDNELVLRVAENWCSETNTFIFPWGEATITLEDMMVLGGFSVLGESVIKFSLTPEMKQVEEKLVTANREMMRISGSSPETSSWMNYFMGTGHELEHEAFLTLWLARFVFPRSCNGRIVKWYFRIAVGLSRGTLIALAPAVLASIYRDMSLLRGRIAGFNGLDIAEVPKLELTAPLQLVKLWIWERFPTLRSNPNGTKEGEPRSAMWHNIKRLEAVNVRLTIDSSGECFQWLPYGATTCISSFCRSYRDKEQWLSDCEDFIRDRESFVRCVRVSELVGIDNGIQKYLPHRVAMQFGYDLDIPASVIRCINSPEIAWNDYNRPFNCVHLHIPPNLRGCCTTVRYIQWWRKSYIVHRDVTNGILKQGRRSSRVPPTVKRLKSLECFVSMLKFDRREHINNTTPCTNSDWTLSVHRTAAKVGKPEEAETDGTCKNNVGDASIAFETRDNKLSEEVILGNAEEEMQTTKTEHLDSPVKNRRSCGDGQTRSIGLELEAKIENLERMLAQVKATFAAKLEKGKGDKGAHHSQK